MTRKSYVNKAPDMRNAQMNAALVKALDPQLGSFAYFLKKIANHKTTALEPKLPFAQLAEKMHQENITRTHIDWHQLCTNPTLPSPSIIKYRPSHDRWYTKYGTKHRVWDQRTTPQVLEWSKFWRKTNLSKILKEMLTIGTSQLVSPLVPTKHIEKHNF